MNIYPIDETNRINRLDVVYLRRMFFVFVLLYAFFGIIDTVLYPNMWQTLFIIRFGIVIPFLILTMVLSYGKSFYKFYQIPVTFSFFIGGCGIAHMLILKPDNIIYYGGLFMVLFSGFLLIKLPLIPATIAGWMIVFYLLAGSLLFHGDIPSDIFYGTIFFVGANVIGMAGNYNIMMANRQNLMYLKEIKEVNRKLGLRYTEKAKRIHELESLLSEHETLIKTKTKNKTLTETLISLEDLLQSHLQNQEPMFIIAIDLNFNYLYVNEHYRKVMLERYKRTVTMGTSLLSVFKNPENRETTQRHFELAFRGTSHTKVETYQKNGIRHYEVQYTPLYSEDHQIIGAISYSIDITKRIRNEMIMAEIENRFKETTEHSRTFTYDLDLQGLYTYVSPMIKDILGYDPEELVGKKYYYDLYPNLLKDKYHTDAEIELKKNKKLNGFINPLLNKMGETLWFSTNLIPIMDVHEKIIAYRGSDMDVTELKKSEDTLDMFKTMAEQAEYGIAISNMEGILVYLNDTFAKLHGWQKNELLGQPILSVHNEEQQERVILLLDHLQEKGGFTSEEVWHVTKDGQPFPTIMSAKRIKGSDLEDYFVATMIDISLQKEIQTSLLESEKRYRIVSEISNTGVWEYDIKNEFLWCSPEYFKMLGYDYHQFQLKPHNVQETWVTLIHEDDRDRALQTFETFFTEKPNRLYENHFRMRCQDGTYRWIWSRGHFVRDDQGNPKDIVVGTHIDITEQKEKQDEIEHISFHDFMTQIPNRRYFQERLEHYDHSDYYPIGILMMDFNGLKVINDAFGHHTGNVALKQVAAILKKRVTPPSVYARIGGDEFAVIFPQAKQAQIDGFIETFNRDISQTDIEGIHYSLAIGSGMKTSVDEEIKDILILAENRMYKNKVLEGSSIRNKAIMSILTTLTDKYKEEKVHSERVSRYCRLMGQAMKLKPDDIKELELAGLFHDIGKISIPDHILSKPGRLDEKEWDIMREHTINGYQILRAADEYSDLALYALTHHERYDGKGYPNGLSGHSIPLFSRIIGVVDAYEAMTSDRPYRKALKIDDAILELKRNKDTQFDGQIVDTFIKKVLNKELLE